MENADPFVLGLRRLMEANPELNPANVAKGAGLDNSTIRKMLEDGKRSPNLRTALAICRYLGVNIMEMVGERAPVASEHEYVSIPRYGAELSAGGGAINTTEPVLDFIPFTADFLADRLRRDDVEGLVMVKAAGESMEPTITDGDLVMVDTADQKHRAGIFAFLLSGESYVKRLEWIDQGVTIISDHPAYPARALSEDEAFVGDFELIGRVRWVGRTFA
ncbi:MAG: LexA family transcriptional regulator [Pseudomonadota bacterium]